MVRLWTWKEAKKVTLKEAKSLGVTAKEYKLIKAMVILGEKQVKQ